jgi:MIP family channel proteins
VRKALLAECLGTFGIVFAPCLLSVTGKLPGGDPSLLAMSLVSGLAVTAMIGAVGHLSGAHLNPAVSVGLASVGKFSWKSVPGYALAQCLGSALAAGLVRLLFGPGLFGAHVPLAGHLSQALALEAVLGFFLMWLVMAAADDERTKNAPHGLIIGTYVVVAMLIAGPLGAVSMNPARSFGPALVSGDAPLTFYWIYLFGPMLGMLLAAKLYQSLR